jgi:hypothetical protein
LLIEHKSWEVSFLGDEVSVAEVFGRPEYQATVKEEFEEL